MNQHKGMMSQRREAFHRRLVEHGPLSVQTNGAEKVASNADKDQRTSRVIALHIAEQLGASENKKAPGQKAGKQFEDAVTHFLENALSDLSSFLPGRITVTNVGGKRNIDHMAQFWPYRHLDDLAKQIEDHPELLAVLGNSYSISPDVLVTREPFGDHEFNAEKLIVDQSSALHSPLRAENFLRRNQSALSAPEIVHSVVSCKWTMRSDRAQNSRSEALNLIRNRKGRSPHIVVVTAEPTPSRLSSLALGTGDIDMLYHFALYELEQAVRETGNDEAKDMLSYLIGGERIRDISDLPIDLLV